MFQDYDWELETLIGGIPITIESAHEANTSGEQENGGEVDDIRAYADTLGIDLDLYRRVYGVGGSPLPVTVLVSWRSPGDGMDTIALVAPPAVTLLTGLIFLMSTGREVVAVTTEGEQIVVVEDAPGDAVDSELTASMGTTATSDLVLPARKDTANMSG